LPAAMARCTAKGAFAGAAAVPSACNAAVPDVVVVVVVEVVPPGGPDPPVWAIAGTALSMHPANSSPASNLKRVAPSGAPSPLRPLLCVSDRKPFSFVGLRG
jgi:hypothetical protein